MLLKSVAYFLIRIILSFKNPTVKLGRGSQVLLSTTFEGKNAIGSKSYFRGYIGRGSYMGQNCWINASIGRYCSIASNVSVIDTTHPSKRFVSTNPMFFSTRKQNGYSYVHEQKYEECVKVNEHYSIIIGNDVWIGENATIMGGITIGDGAIIGANALVTADVSPYSIVVGVPAKELRKRFSDEEILQLEKIQWWLKPEDWIISNIDDFCDIDRFLKNCMQM